jgi:CDP-2,3-bis-(O-geranylgeranyl)-sn-glycerol synthase
MMEKMLFEDIYGLVILTFIYAWPAYLANMFPVLWGKVPGVRKLFVLALDGGKNWNGKRILGDNKTWGGLISAVIGGAIGGLMSFTFIESLWRQEAFFWQDYLGFLGVGAVLGFGAIMGDVLKSFFKRRVGIASGKPWLFFDQVDFVIGAWVASWFITGLGYAFSPGGTWMFFVVALIITPLLHLLSNVIAYKLGLKKVWW